MSKRNFFRIKKNWQCITVGVIGGILSAVIVLMILSAVMVNYDIPSDFVKYSWIIIAVISGFSAGAFTGRFVKSKGFLWGSVSSAVLAVICIIVLLAVNSFNINLLILSVIPVFVLMGCVGGIISSNLR